MITPGIERLVRAALEEDLAGGDLTTEATVSADAETTARAVAKSRLVVCGFAVFRECFLALEPSLRVTAHHPDGALVEAGTVFWEVAGATRAILMAERTALNFVQRMSGTASLARVLVTALPAGSKTRVTDTRKTTPGLRALERYAVRVGGAFNHRDSLGAAVLIKDNHLRAAGGVASAIAQARLRAPHTSRVEVEVESLAELDEALAAGADIVMLDNFAPADVPRAVARVAGRALVEVSGNITLARIAELAEAGVDVISVGALTHSAPAADISLRIE